MLTNDTNSRGKGSRPSPPASGRGATDPKQTHPLEGVAAHERARRLDLRQVWAGLRRRITPDLRGLTIDLTDNEVLSDLSYGRD